eukprot:812207-Rhodomonas_salina.1
MRLRPGARPGDRGGQKGFGLRFWLGSGQRLRVRGPAERIRGVGVDCGKHLGQNPVWVLGLRALLHWVPAHRPARQTTATHVRICSVAQHSTAQHSTAQRLRRVQQLA